ncbi:MAG TPA: hypothetical protein DHU33_05555 [Firmicutes bacterium]|nr:hypothetical protein [Bacillota bacterium]
MANIKNVVKVMNFHSLLRVDKAKRKADNYKALEEEILSFMNKVLNNKNLNLDKRLITSKPDGKIVNFYIGNDLGFCGNFNSSVKHVAEEDKGVIKIVVGEKIFMNKDDVALNIAKEDFYNDFKKVEDIIKPLLINRRIKEINAIFNRYYNVNNIKLEKKKLFPLEFDDSKNTEDFVIETDASSMFEDLLLLYIECELQIIESNSWAAENIMRQNLTSESLKKIDEIEEEKQKQVRKEKKYQAFKKQMANYRKGI